MDYKNLTWFDLINKLKALFKNVEQRVAALEEEGQTVIVPTPPASGEYFLKATNGVITWELFNEVGEEG